MFNINTQYGADGKEATKWLEVAEDEMKTEVEQAHACLQLGKALTRATGRLVRCVPAQNSSLGLTGVTYYVGARSGVQ